jgi:hypothetical protein
MRKAFSFALQSVDAVCAGYFAVLAFKKLNPIRIKLFSPCLITLASGVYLQKTSGPKWPTYCQVLLFLSLSTPARKNPRFFEERLISYMLLQALSQRIKLRYR